MDVQVHHGLPGCSPNVDSDVVTIRSVLAVEPFSGNVSPQRLGLSGGRLRLRIRKIKGAAPTRLAFEEEPQPFLSNSRLMAGHSALPSNGGISLAARALEVVAVLPVKYAAFVGAAMLASWPRSVGNGFRLRSCCGDRLGFLDPKPLRVVDAERHMHGC